MADVYSDRWLRPEEWKEKFNIDLVPMPLIVVNKKDRVRWREDNGNLTDFSVSIAWEALRDVKVEVDWYRVVWFSQCIPRHAFLFGSL